MKRKQDQGYLTPIFARDFAAGIRPVGESGAE